MCLAREMINLFKLSEYFHYLENLISNQFKTPFARVLEDRSSIQKP